MAAKREQLWLKACHAAGEESQRLQCSIPGCPRTIGPYDFVNAHIKSRKHGGSDDVSNLRATCSKCNEYMGVENLNSYEKRLKTPSGRTFTLKVTDSDPDYDPYIGKKISKMFGTKWYTGKIVSYDHREKYYAVEYEDGDSEEFDRKTVKRLICSS